MVKQIEEFVYDPNAKETLTFHIQSYALKKALGKEVTILYMNTGLFTEFTRQSTEVVIRKTNNFQQINFLKGKNSSKKQESDSETKSGKNTAATSSNKNAKDLGLGFCQDDDEIEDITPVQTVKKVSKVAEKQQQKPQKTIQVGKKLMTEDQIEEEVELLQKFEIGFSQVIQRISHSKKTVVGHNLALDLGFVFHQFFKEMP